MYKINVINLKHEIMDLDNVFFTITLFIVDVELIKVKFVLVFFLYLFSSYLRLY